MDEEMCEDNNLTVTTPVKKKKKSKKRKHDEIEHDLQSVENYDRNETKDESKIDKNVDQIGKEFNFNIEPNEDDENYEFLMNEESDNVKQIHDETTNDQLIQKSSVSQQFSCVEHLRKKIKFPVLPIAINQEFKIIKQTLIHKWKYRFINELNGFLYYFENLELIDEINGYQPILDDLPFIYYNIIADFYVFRPRIGEYLRAKISCFEDSNKIISCSTDVEMTVSIELPEEISEKLNKYLKLNQEIIFLIENIDYSKMIIKGTINKRSIKLMEEHISIELVSSANTEQNDLNESNLDDFFAS